MHNSKIIVLLQPRGLFWGEKEVCEDKVSSRGSVFIRINFSIMHWTLQVALKTSLGSVGHRYPRTVLQPYLCF